VKLQIGGTEPKAGWTILNIQPGEGVDIVASCETLPMPDSTVEEIYCSHVLEHLEINAAHRALAGFFRVLIPGGLLRVSVPDLSILCQLFISPQLSVAAKYNIQRIIMGGQLDEYDFHKTMWYDDLFYSALVAHGFTDIRRVDHFNDLFPGDCSTVGAEGVAISLNVEARKG